MESRIKALIDGDNLAVAMAATAEDSEEWVAHARAHDMVERILNETSSTHYEVWLTGQGNFRYNIYPEYKANRIGAKRPKWESSTKAYLRREWNAFDSSGCEADDMLGVRQLAQSGTIICHLDKDMNMIPGLHYNWELRRNNEIIKEARIYEVSQVEADRFFYFQLLTGDFTDNVKGVSGIGAKKAERILSGCQTIEEMFHAVRSQYSSDEEFLMNAQCLWIWRKPNDIYQIPEEFLNQKGD